MTDIPPFRLQDAGVTLEASVVPWDSALFGFPVAQLNRVLVEPATPGRLRSRSAEILAPFTAWLDRHDIGLASARLASQAVREGFLLEDLGFRYVETVLHPCLRTLQARDDLGTPDLEVRPGTREDLPVLTDAARQAFSHERFHLDPRLDSDRADARYAFFVEHALEAPEQDLLVINDGQRPVAFFVVAARPDHAVHWYLTAVLPAAQGQGYGHRSWRAVMRHHRSRGIRQITTTIAARNHRVLGLYAKLDFRFLAAESTFHWVRG